MFNTLVGPGITGSQGVASQVQVADTTDSTCWVSLFEGQTGNQSLFSDGSLTYDATTGELSATLFAGALNGTVGATTPAAVAGTTGVFSGNLTQGNWAISSSSNHIQNVAAGTAARFLRMANTGGDFYVAVENAAGDGFTGAAAYESVLYSPSNNLYIRTPSATISGTLTSTGDFVCNAKFNVTAATGALQMDGTAQINGNTGIGGASIAGASLILRTTATTGVSQEGINIQPVFTSSATTWGRANFALVSTAAASFTMNQAAAYYALNAVVGATSAITTQYGFYVENLTSAGTNWAIYTAGTTASYFGGTQEWGGGASISSSNKVRPDYAAMRFHAQQTVTVDYANVFNLVDDFTTNGEATVSTADQANNQLVFGDSRVYMVTQCMEGTINAAAQLIAITAFSIDQTTATVTDITAADPGVVTTSAAHGLTESMKVKFTEIVGTMSALNNRIFLVGTVADATHFEIQDLSDTDFDTTGLVYTSDGATAEAISTGAHTHQTYPNNVRTATSCPFSFDATSGDALELYVANDSGTDNFVMESSRLMISAM